MLEKSLVSFSKKDTNLEKRRVGWLVCLVVLLILLAVITNASSKKDWWLCARVFSSAAVADGNVYVGSSDSRLSRAHFGPVTSTEPIHFMNKTFTKTFSSEDIDPAIIVLSADNMESMRDSLEFIRQSGGKIIHKFPTHVMIGNIPRSIRDTLIGQEGIERIEYSIVDPSTVVTYGETAKIAVEAWNNNFMNQAASNGLVPPPDFEEPPPIRDDMRIISEKRGEYSEDASTPPHGAGFYDTSEYMIGDISVAIILPESNGAIDPNQENWEGSDISAVVSEIQAGLNWWASREPNAHLSFTYTILVVETSYEPIGRPGSDEYLWISEVMQNIGYSTGDYFDQVSSYLNVLRDEDGTDWAVAMFVVDSWWDLDGFFSDGWFAYAYLGGPFMVMTYDNNGYFIFNMDAVTAHEFGHIFYALDEYYDAHEPPTARSGYLNVENQNSEYDGSSNVPCIMRGSVSPYTSGEVCDYTRGQIGWRDTDGDGILNIVDFFPENNHEPYSLDPTPTFIGQASSQATYPNNNPYGEQQDITINTIWFVEYWVEDLSRNIIRESQWATSLDGLFDSDFEGYAYSVSPELPPGTYYSGSIAWNSEGNGWLTYRMFDIQSKWNSSVAYIEGAASKPHQGISWMKETDPSSWSATIMKASASSTNGDTLYGPYITEDIHGESMLGKFYTAIFRLKVSSNHIASDVLKIDISHDVGTVLSSMTIKASDFTSTDTWQEFYLDFTVPDDLTYGLEFRVQNLNQGAADVYADVIVISARDLYSKYAIGEFETLFANNRVRMIYPSDSSEKPLGMGAAMLSDWTASGIIFPRLGTLTEGVDTNPLYVNQSTGKPLGDAGEGIITFGGPDVNLVVYYAENNDYAPIHFIIGSDRFYFRHSNGTEIPGADLPGSVINFNEDMFVIEVFEDQDGRYVLICQGFGWKGTYAGGKYFDRVIYPELESHTESWIIVKWEDTNGDGFVNAPGNGDTYTIIAIGS